MLRRVATTMKAYRSITFTEQLAIAYGKPKPPTTQSVSGRQFVQTDLGGGAQDVRSLGTRNGLTEFAFIYPLPGRAHLVPDLGRSPLPPAPGADRRRAGPHLPNLSLTSRSSVDPAIRGAALAAAVVLDAVAFATVLRPRHGYTSAYRLLVVLAVGMAVGGRCAAHFMPAQPSPAGAALS